MANRCHLVLQAADKLEHVATEHFWMSGMYWGLTAMELMGRLQDMDTDKVLDWVRDTHSRSCWSASTDTVAFEIQSQHAGYMASIFAGHVLLAWYR